MIFEENSTVRKVNNVTTYFSDICGTIKTKTTLWFLLRFVLLGTQASRLFTDSKVAPFQNSGLT